MKYCVDTNILLWYLDGNPQLSDQHKTIIQNESENIYISIASLWEITIKSGIGKLTLKRGFQNTIDLIRNSHGWVIIPIITEHLFELYNLPFYHNDPFDRIIFAQCKFEKFHLIYTDKIFDKYYIDIEDQKT